MKKLLCAGVFALATIGLLPDAGSQARRPGNRRRPMGPRRHAAINIPRIKSVLKLTPAQEHILGAG